MKSISALNKVYKKGLFGNYKNRDESNLLRISELKDLLIVQIVQYKNSLVSAESIDILGLNLKEQVSLVSTNKEIRILWFGPKNWLFISKNKEYLKNIYSLFKESDFAITDLSNSRSIIEIEGNNSLEVLKKGCPFNFDELKKNSCINSVFNGITITIDMIDEDPYKIRLFALRSFGESLYHSITDACSEFGYKII
jgi:heterotetrameric sarcosine oxidase gamma subunit